MLKVAILFDNFGPYHLARLKAAASACDLLAIEFGSSSAEYDWVTSSSEALNRVALNETGFSQSLSRHEFKDRLYKCLNDFVPSAVVVPGWGYRGALLALKWCLANNVPAIVMSESTPWDERRNPLKEWVKQRVVSFFSSALVGGAPHAAYMQQLGMPLDRIFVGYDAVDNLHFAENPGESGAVREGGQDMNRTYFLASARFIGKKNLPALLKAYAVYRRNHSLIHAAHPVSCPEKPWDLILLGDGPLRPELEKLRGELGLEDFVHMPGFKQYDELPFYYARAGAFVHTSTTEQWGLVVNEAMASGLPVLVSNRCGCAADLVKNGENGWTFDPTDEQRLSELMLNISSDEESRKRMGNKSRELIKGWGPERFASGLSSAIKIVVETPKHRPKLLDRLILLILSWK